MKRQKQDNSADMSSDPELGQKVHNLRTSVHLKPAWPVFASTTPPVSCDVCSESYLLFPLLWQMPHKGGGIYSGSHFAVMVSSQEGGMV